MARLGEVFECQITGEWGDECADNGMGTKVLRTTNFTPEGRISYDDVVIRYISEVKAEKKRLHCGDIILEKSGGTEKTPVGRVVFCDESIEDDTYLCNNFTQAMRVNREKAFPRYVFYFMWSLHNSGKTDLLQNKTTGIRNLQVKLYLNTLISFPPLDEQRRIAAVLDKVSDLIAKRRQQLEKLDELVKARFVEMFGDFGTDKFGWGLHNLYDCCEVLDNKRIPITASNRQAGPYPYYGANGIQDYVANYIFDDELVLLAEDGGNFGAKDKPIAYRVSGKCWVNNHAHVLKPKDGVDVDYLCYSLMFYDVSKLISGTTRPKLTQASMSQIEISVPPLELQNRFASFVERVKKTKTRIAHGLERLEMLKKSLMQKYFE